MARYKVIGHVTGLTKGQEISDEQLDKDHPGLGGAKRLLGLKAIEPVGGPIGDNRESRGLNPGNPQTEPQAGEPADGPPKPRASLRK